MTKPLISQRKLALIKQAIEDRISAFAFTSGGLELPPELIERLRKLGFIGEDTLNFIFDSYIYGLFSAAYGETADSMSLPDFIDQIQKVKVPLGPIERAALKQVKRSSYTNIKNIERTIQTQTERILIEGDKAFQRRAAQKIKEELVAGVAERKTFKQVAKAMRKSTKVFAKNFYAVAATEMNNAYAAGRAQEILRRNKGRDPRVYKNPRKDACTHCKRLYLEDDGITPKVFKLSTLIANANNIGRSKAEWKPIIESTHPECRCKLYELPPGFGFDKEGRMTYVGLKKATLFDAVVKRHRAA